MTETEPGGESVPSSTADMNATSPDEPITSKPSATGSKSTFSGPVKQKAKPRKVAGCYWVADGSGWKLKRSKRNDAGRNPTIGYLSGSAYKSLKSNFKGEDLTAELRQWAEKNATEKGIEL